MKETSIDAVVEVENCWLSDRPEQLHKNLSVQHFMKQIILIPNWFNISQILCGSFVTGSISCRCVPNPDPIISILSEIYHKHFVLEFPFSFVSDLVACTDWQLF